MESDLGVEEGERTIDGEDTNDGAVRGMETDSLGGAHSRSLDGNCL